MAANPDTYEHDFYTWTVEQARLLREGRLNDLDREHIAEELEDMGRSEKRELGSRLYILLVHLLKWYGQPERRSRSWRGSIFEQRRRIEALLQDSPSLYQQAGQILVEEYPSAREKALAETGLYHSSDDDRDRSP